MVEFSFEVGGTSFHLEANDDVIGYLKFLYHAFPSSTAPHPDWRISWDGKRCTWRAHSRPAEVIFANDSRHHKAITTSLISRLLIDSDPQNLILHGNALINISTGKLLLLVGESGAGKTTLTQMLSNNETDWDPFAEDVLLIRTDAAELQPFPRAPALREWEQSSGMRHGAKHLIPTSAKYAKPVSLSHAATVLLKHSATIVDNSAEKEQPCDLVWVTHCDKELVAKMRRAKLPMKSVEEAHGLFCIEYERHLTNEERDRQAHLLRSGNSMIMRTMSKAAAHWREANRPVWPEIRRLTPAEGVNSSLPHLVRPSAAFAAQPAGRLFMRLSKALGAGHFYVLVPGGSPSDTVKLLLETMSQ